MKITASYKDESGEKLLQFFLQWVLRESSEVSKLFSIGGAEGDRCYFDLDYNLQTRFTIYVSVNKL